MISYKLSQKGDEAERREGRKGKRKRRKLQEERKERMKILVSIMLRKMSIRSYRPHVLAKWIFGAFRHTLRVRKTERLVLNVANMKR